MRDLLLIKIRAYVEKEPRYYARLFDKVKKGQDMLQGIDALDDLDLCQLFERVIMLKYRQR